MLEVGRELHKRLGTMGTHLTTLGSRLNKTVEAYNAFNASLDRNVVTQARRFSSLQGLEPSRERSAPLEVLAVPAQKPDVHAGEVERPAADAALHAADPEPPEGRADAQIRGLAREATADEGDSAIA